MIGDTELDNRFNHHPPSSELVAKNHDIVRHAFRTIAGDMDRMLPDGREKSLVMTHLEDALFQANASIARNQVGGSF